MVRPSTYARRVTLATPFEVRGPAAGHRLMRNQADPQGRTVLGTLNKCASSQTPWGTYLSGEENWMNDFARGEKIGAQERRWGMREKSAYGWEAHDPRFDAGQHPNEPHRLGWVVELAPMDLTSMAGQTLGAFKIFISIRRSSRFRRKPPLAVGPRQRRCGREPPPVQRPRPTVRYIHWSPGGAR